MFNGEDTPFGVRGLMARALICGREIGYNLLANDTYIDDVRRHGRNFASGEQT